MKLLTCSLLSAVLALSAAAADVTGKWTGMFTPPAGQGNESTAVLLLKQSGTEITGTAGQSEDEQMTIEKGKIEGNKVTFEVHAPGPVYKVSLVLDGDRLSGNVVAERDGQQMTAKLDVKRAK